MKTNALKTEILTPQFVEFIPEVLEEGTIYISEEYRTASHKCCCGCGQRVVTPLRRGGWQLTVQDGTVTLYPSIGNWSFPCESHYWIQRNQVVPSYPMSKEEIQAGRDWHSAEISEYFDTREGFLSKLKRWLLG